MAGRHAALAPQAKRPLLETALQARSTKFSAIAVTATAVAVVPFGIAAGQGNQKAQAEPEAKADVRVERAANQVVTAGPAQEKPATAPVVRVKAKPAAKKATLHPAGEESGGRTASTTNKVKLQAKVTGDSSAPKTGGHEPGTSVDASQVPVTHSHWVRPLGGSITSEYGNRGSLAAAGGTIPFHNGIDFGAAMGTPIHAANDGVVVHVGYNDFDTHTGGIVVILHRTPAGDFLTSYNHMSLSWILVKEGDTVKAGQSIAKVGNEGRSTGPHMHFSTRVVTDLSSPLTSWELVPPREFMSKLHF